MCQTITSRRGGCRQGGQDGVAGHAVDHLEPSEVEQQTTTWLCVSTPGAAPGLSASSAGWPWPAEGPGGSP